ncbi:HEAT repeat domain-containing protein, partial [filamentous cyanobacterium LEGE 11480]
MSEFDLQPYLKSVTDTYCQWWNLYTLTDAEGKQREPQEQETPFFDFGLMVQRSKAATNDNEQADRPKDDKPKEDQADTREKIERLPVLEGLQKYSAEHVLLVGRPGSGKSTTLARLMLEAATEGKQIPVLVELRAWQTSLVELIRNFLKRHDWQLDAGEIEQLLKDDRLLLLVDGVNELPSETARVDVVNFHRNHPKVAMIFTTRDLSLGGDLGIAQKLEMQPLTETQMQAFVQAYIPEQAEMMMRQLQGRLRELGQTPLLLWMLCSLFQQARQIPQNLGQVFRAFTQGYEQRIKQDVVVESDRRLWPELLKALAAQMMQGKAPTEFRVAIPRAEIYHLFAAYLKIDDPQVLYQALDDLLKHHLIQQNGALVEFRHQLIQEYYAAEWLLEQVQDLDDDALKRNYLNYLKWTEPIALMLALVEDETLAARVVEQSLNIDWQVGARFAGEVLRKFQQHTTTQVTRLNIQPRLKINLLTKTNSEAILSDLLKLVEDEVSYVRQRAASGLGDIGTEKAIPGLLKLVEDEVSYVRQRAASGLGDIGTEKAIPGLLKLVEDEVSYVREQAASALGGIGTEKAIPGLLKLVEDEVSYVREQAASALGGIGTEKAIPGLLKLVEDKVSYVRERAASALGDIGTEKAIPGLLKLVEDEVSYVREQAASALGGIGTEKAIPGLLKLVEDKDRYVREQAASALGGIGTEKAIPGLLKLVEDKDRYVREQAASALGGIGTEKAIPGLLKLVEDKDRNVREQAASGLGGIGTEKAI